MNNFTKDITIGKEGNVGMRHLNDPVTHVISKSLCAIDRVQKNKVCMVSRLERSLTSTHLLFTITEKVLCLYGLKHSVSLVS